MEPKEDIPSLQLRPSEIGIIKEETLFKWLEGQEEWDRRFKYRATKVMKNRKKFEAKANSMLKNARQRGLLLAGESDDPVERPIAGRSSVTHGAIQEDRRWGPLDLVDEQPPPTAIAARRDTVSFVIKILGVYRAALARSACSASEEHLSRGANNPQDHSESEKNGRCPRCSQSH
jgi:hypothetical protein